MTSKAIQNLYKNDLISGLWIQMETIECFDGKRKSRKECERRVEFDLMGKSKREGKFSKFACTNYPFFFIHHQWYKHDQSFWFSQISWKIVALG